MKSFTLAAMATALAIHTVSADLGTMPVHCKPTTWNYALEDTMAVVWYDNSAECQNQGIDLCCIVATFDSANSCSDANADVWSSQNMGNLEITLDDQVHKDHWWETSHKDDSMWTASYLNLPGTGGVSNKGVEIEWFSMISDLFDFANSKTDSANVAPYAIHFVSDVGNIHIGALC